MHYATLNPWKIMSCIRTDYKSFIYEKYRVNNRIYRNDGICFDLFAAIRTV